MTSGIMDDPIAGLSVEASLRCHKAGLHTALDVGLAKPLEIERLAGPSRISASEFARMQQAVQLASIPTITSLWEESKRLRCIVEPARPARTGASPSQIVAPTPGQDDPPMTLFAGVTSPNATLRLRASTSPPVPDPDDISRGAVAVGSGGASKASVRTRISTGVGTMDEMLDGGFERGTITDLAGDSGSGKTQLVLQAAMSTLLGLSPQAASEPAASPDWSRAGHVALLHTGARMGAHQMVARLRQMVHARYPCASARQPLQTLSTQVSPSQPMPSGVFRSSAKRRRIDEGAAWSSDGLDPESVGNLAETYVQRMLKNLHIAYAPTFEALETIVRKTLPDLCNASARDGSLDLIVIDNLATVLNEVHKNDIEGNMRRSQLLHGLSDVLREVAAERLPTDGTSTTRPSAAVVVVNHLADAPESTSAFSERASRFRPSVLASMQNGLTPLQIETDNLHVQPDFEVQTAQSRGLFSTLCALDRSACSSALENNGIDGFSGKVAQLGPAWASCVNCRIIVNKTQQRALLPSSVDKADANAEVKSRLTSVRQATVALSTWSPSGLELARPAHFAITNAGVIGIGHDSIQSHSALSVAGPHSDTSIDVQNDPQGNHAHTPGSMGSDELFAATGLTDEDFLQAVADM